MLRVLFTVAYFLCLLKLIDLIFRNFHSVLTDLIAIGCIVIAFVLSVGLANITVKKIKESGSSNRD